MILDTSVLYESFVDAPYSEEARAILQSGQPLRSPDLILIEIAGAITRAVRRGELTPSLAGDMFNEVQGVMPEMDASRPFIERAFQLSLDLIHPISDCVFLAQAEAQADVLVTADRHFVRKLAGTPHSGRAVFVCDWRP